MGHSSSFDISFPFLLIFPKKIPKLTVKKMGLKEKNQKQVRVKVSCHLMSLVYTSLSHLSPETDCCASSCARSSINWRTDQVYGSIQFAPLLYFHDLQALLVDLKAVWFNKFIKHQQQVYHNILDLYIHAHRKQMF